MASRRCAVEVATPSRLATSVTVIGPSNWSMVAIRRALSTLATAYGGGVFSGLSTLHHPFQISARQNLLFRLAKRLPSYCHGHHLWRHPGQPAGFGRAGPAERHTRA